MGVLTETIRIEKADLNRIFDAIAALDRLLSSVEADANNVQLDIGRLRRRHRQALAMARDQGDAVERERLLSTLELTEKQRKL